MSKTLIDRSRQACRESVPDHEAELLVSLLEEAGREYELIDETTERREGVWI